MPMYTKQGFEKGSYEAYKWLLDNHPPINTNMERNVFTLFFRGHKLLNAIADAMDPYTFAVEMRKCETYRNWDKDKVEKAPVWYRAEFLRETMIGTQFERENDRRKVIQILKEKEERAIRNEPLRLRQLEWENERWLDLSQEEINLRNNLNEDKKPAPYAENIRMPIVRKFATSNGYVVWVFEKLNGFYMGILFNPYDVEDGIKALRYSYSFLCEEAGELTAQQAKPMPKLKTTRRTVKQPSIDKVREEMGLTSEQFPDDLNQSKLF